MNKQKLVVIGNGMAGMRCVEEILEIEPKLFDITVFGSEPHVNYNRILLSTVLQGSTSFDDITINNQEWYVKKKIQLYTRETVVKIDIEKRTVKTDKKRTVLYDKLIISTGSVPFLIPVPGSDKEGVITFRTIEDCQKMIEASKQYRRAVVIGGGLLGLEAARGLLNLGMEVNVVHIGKFLMERQLDRTASQMLKNELEKQGMNFLLEKDTKEIIGNERVECLLFKDGTKIDTDIVVMAAGVRPNVQLVRESGLDVNRAILVNDFLETNVPGIYAVGECAEHRGVVYGLVKPLYEQGKVLAKHICGTETQGYQGSVLSTQLKISGVDVFSAGQFAGDETTREIAVYDNLNGVYKKTVFQENKMIGAVLFGDTSDSSRLLNMILAKKDIPDNEKTALYKTSAENVSSVPSMALSDIICNCNAVSKGGIIEAVQQGGLTTVEQVKKCTKASGSCGGCKPLVSQLLTYIQSDDFDEVIERKAMCSCTKLTEDEVIREIQVRNLLSHQDVMNALEWEQPEGCATCRAALNYYLGMIHPNYQSSLKEDFYAPMESDGTYSIIPQMYGGMTSAEQLRKIAEVVEKYRIPNITVTSEQRIQLMGIKKELLTKIMADLNMPLYPPQSSMIRSIHIVIGEDNCRCNKIPAHHMAADLEKKLEFQKTPHPVTMGVSACIHDGEEAKTKDIGLIKIDRGWEIHVGGNREQDVRCGELLYVAETNETAIEMVTAFIQYYRETASYLERSGEWVDRIGLIHIREVLFDTEMRFQLIKQLKEDVLKYREMYKSNFLIQQI